MCWDFLVPVEPHGKRAPSLGLGAKIGGVAHHLGLRGLHLNRREPVALGIHAQYAGSLAVEIAHDVACVSVRHEDLSVHDRLQELGASPIDAVGKGVAARDLERHAGRVDRMEAAVVQGGFHVHDGESAYDSGVKGPYAALLYGWDVLPWHGPAYNAIIELEAGASWQWLYLKVNLRELAVPPALLLVAIVGARLSADGLLVGHFGRHEKDLNAELTLHLFYGNVDVYVAQSAQQQLRGVRLAADAQTRVFLSHAGDGVGQLVNVCLGLREGSH